MDYISIMTSQRSSHHRNTSFSSNLSYQADEDAIFDDDDSINSPNLLATSAEDNRLLPSLSTISLLSLGRDERRGSRTSFHQQQRYPLMYRKSSQSIQTTSSTQSLQTLQAAQRDVQVPETPKFGPVSLGSSPSGFVLSQNPPSSLQRGNGFRNMNMSNSTLTNTISMTSMTNPTSSNSMNFMNNTNGGLNGNVNGLRIDMNEIGNMSPNLDPIASDIPMTPLMLTNPEDFVSSHRD